MGLDLVLISKRSTKLIVFFGVLSLNKFGERSGVVTMEDDQQREPVDGSRLFFRSHPTGIIQMRTFGDSDQSPITPNQQTMPRGRSSSSDTCQREDEDEDRTITKEGPLVSQDGLEDNLGILRENEEGPFLKVPTVPKPIESQSKV
jgi:hypothetical protein